MGIGWMFGFLASAVDVQILWWIFVVINSLHGPLLLASVLRSAQFKQLMSETSKHSKDTKKQNICPSGKSAHQETIDRGNGADMKNDQRKLGDKEAKSTGLDPGI